MRPSRPEPNMRETNTGPGDQRCQSTHGQQPIEYDARARAQVDIGEAAEQKSDGEGDERSTFAVDVAEEFGRLTVGGESSEGSRGCEGGRISNREDSDKDDGVEDRREN